MIQASYGNIEIFFNPDKVDFITHDSNKITIQINSESLILDYTGISTSANYTSIIYHQIIKDINTHGKYIPRKF